MRSTHVGQTVLRNFLTAAAKGIHKALHPDVVEQCIEDGTKDLIKKMPAATAFGVPAGIAVVAAGVCNVAPFLSAFFIANAPLLHQFAIIAGSDLSWLPSFLNWLKMQQARRDL